MGFYHVCRAFVVLIVSALLTTPAYGQSKLQEQTPEKLKLSNAEMTQYKALSGLVDAVIVRQRARASRFHGCIPQPLHSI